MVTEGLDFNFLLLENYKKLNISEEELATIFVIKHFIDHGNPFVNADLLSLKMTLNVKRIDEILANLLTRGFIEYVTKGKKTVTTLNPLVEKDPRFHLFLTDRSNHPVVVGDPLRSQTIFDLMLNQINYRNPL